jgi:gluconolactonase
MNHRLNRSALVIGGCTLLLSVAAFAQAQTAPANQPAQPAAPAAQPTAPAAQPTAPAAQPAAQPAGQGAQPAAQPAQPAAQPAQPAAQPTEPVAPRSVIAEGATMQKLQGEYGFTEGPAVDKEGNIYFTDQPNDRIVKWNAADGTVEDWLKPAGHSNGLWMDPEGNLIACADEKNQLWKIAPDKTITVMIENFEGNLLNGPNDVWMRPEGGLYFTDPLYRRNYWERDPAMQQNGQHVYYLAKDATVPIRVATDYRQPNGIIGTPDGKTLYIADIGAGQTYAYDITADGTLGPFRLFCSQGSDGMSIDNEGNVYLTGQGVTVYSPQGQMIQRIDVPERTANVTFGGKDFDLLFITARTGIYGVKTRVKGAGK